MWARIKRLKNGKHTRGNSALLWAVLLSLICGVIEFGQPVEDQLRYARNAKRMHNASGDIVVIGVDGHSLNKYKKRWPWPRADLARMIDALNAAGAKRIFFDFNFEDYTDPQNDQAMVAALKRAPGRVFLATRFVIDQSTGVRTDHVSIPEFTALSRGVHINIWVDPMGIPVSTLYKTSIAGSTYNYMGSELANVFGSLDEKFRIDYSVDASSIPRISAVDVLDGRFRPASVAGKDIVIASSSIELGDMYHMPWRGLTSGVYFNVLAAETLKRGRPQEYGWFGPWVFAIFVTAAFMRIRRRILRRSIYVTGLLSLAVAPMFFEANLIFVQIVPALLALGIVGVARARANFRKKLHDSGITNKFSGLLNLNAVREAGALGGGLMVAMKVNNYLQVLATMPSEREKELVDQIASRLGFGTEQVALYQGDEGVFVWLTGDASELTVIERIDALHSFFRSPVSVDGQLVNLFVSFGIDKDDQRSLQTRLSGVVLAAEEAAKSGERWSMSDSDKSKDRQAQMLLVGRLDQAIADGEIWVAYQPQLDIATNRICGAEALVRWTHPEHGEISPGEFILMAEEQNRIDSLTLHVLEAAIKTAAAINLCKIDFEIAVNLSPRALAGQPIDKLARTMLQKHRLAPRCLTLEITETATMRPDSDFIAVLERLRASGINISIDDYGTGLSTLEYLRSIPANEVKVDRSLVSQIEFSAENRMIVNSTIQMIHALGLTVVAEGVETEAALTLIRQMGCNKAQGYLIGKPVPFRELWKLVGLDPKRAVA